MSRNESNANCSKRLVALGPRTVEFPSPSLQPLLDSTDLLRSAPYSPDTVKKRIDENGYVFLRNLLPRAKVLKARGAILEHMNQQGVCDTSDGSYVNDAKMAEDAPSVFKMEGFDGIAIHPSVKELLECQELYDFFRYNIISDTARTFDYKWLRAVGKDQYTGVHCDNVYMGRGTDMLYTVWIPLGDTSIEQGTLAICSRSNSLTSYQKVRSTYCQLDVDRDKTEGWLSKDPLEITDKYGGQWVTDDFSAGDVLVFGMHTLHASTTNTTIHYRLSCDIRWQTANDEVDERWVLNDKGGSGKGTGHTNYGKETLRSMDVARKEWGI